MKKLLSLLKNKIQDPLFIFGVLFVLGSICFILSPAFKDSSEPMGVMGWIGTILWMLIPIMFFGLKYIMMLFNFLFKRKK